jgi:hypothetical protein
MAVKGNLVARVEPSEKAAAIDAGLAETDCDAFR